MTPAEIGAVSRLGGHAFAGLVSRIEQVHRAIAGRAFTPVLTPATPGIHRWTRLAPLSPQCPGEARTATGLSPAALTTGGGH